LPPIASARRSRRGSGMLFDAQAGSPFRPAMHVQRSGELPMSASSSDLVGRDLYDRDRQPVGKITALYRYPPEVRAPSGAAAVTTGLLRRSRLVDLQDAKVDGAGVRVPHKTEHRQPCSEPHAADGRHVVRGRRCPGARPLLGRRVADLTRRSRGGGGTTMDMFWWLHADSRRWLAGRDPVMILTGRVSSAALRATAREIVGGRQEFRDVCNRPVPSDL
jgi:hypothetical protein